MTRRGALHVRGGATATDLGAVERRAIALASAGQVSLELTGFAHEVLATGAFHRIAPSADCGGGSSSDPRIHRRRCGGRVMALGPGIPLLTLGLPHRSALVATHRLALRPEQVLNRAVRGLLAALRSLGLDPTYPGLDLITVGRRAVAQAAFGEFEGGITLVQFALAIRAPLSHAMALLDRLDPDGAIAAAPLGEAACATWAALLPPDLIRRIDDVQELGRVIGRGFATAFDLEVVAVEAWPADAGEAPGDTAAATGVPEPSAECSVVRRMIRTGLIEAWARSTGGRITSAGILGDLLAPPATLAHLSTALAGRPASRLGIAAAATAVIDGQEDYVLGLAPDELIDVLAAALGIA